MERGDRINQDQFFELISSEEIGWQSIIYDLIKTEQLDPWDIDLGILAEKYVEIIQKLEEADFFVSSKVLLACSLLLRLKSEILVNSYIQDLNDALYGRKDEKKYEIEKILIDEDELPILVPRTPMARHKKVTLKELIAALDKAITTENRRIKKEIKGRQAQKSMLTVMPNNNFIPLKTRVKTMFGIITNHLSDGNKHIRFSHIASEKEEKLATFVPMLHLSNNGKIFLRQPVHFEDIHITLKIHEEELKELEEELGLLGEEGTEEESESELLEEFNEESKEIEEDQDFVDMTE
ncbi:MAG: segregation/condensation protein A [Nanoarchaeota archaeon]|nr:segregation/condensation protein A [Nanoarchaeota archaeon]